MLRNEELTVRAAALTIFLCTVFGANTVAIKLCLSGFGSYTAAGVRFAAASLMIYLWARLKNITLSMTMQQMRQMMILGMNFVVQLSCFYVGIGKTTASHSVLLSNILPFLVLIEAHFFIPGDRITLKKGLGITLGFFGVMFLFFDDPGMTGDLKQGDLIVMMAVILWSFNAVYGKRVIANYNVAQITLYPMLLATPFFFLAGYFWDARMIGQLTGTVILAMMYQALINTVFGFIAWNSLLKKYGTTALHSFVFIMPLSGVLSGVLILGEAVTPHLFASMALIVAGVMIVNMKIKKRPI